mgnify:FL=1
MSLQISGADLLPSISGNEKIPTGGRGNLVTTPDQLAAYIEQKLGLIAALDDKLDVDDYPAKETLTGTEAIPLVDGVKEAITPDQIINYAAKIIAERNLQSVLLSEDFVDIEAVKPITAPDNFEQIPAATLSAANLNWAGAVKIADAASGGYIRFLPIIDGIAATAYTFDLTKGSLTFATVTYIPNTFPPPVNAAGGDRAYVTCGIYRDQLQDGSFAANRSIAAILWNRNSSEFQFFANNGALVIPTGVIASQNTEYHTQITITGTNCKVWINGLLVINTTIILPVNTSVVAAIGLITQLFGGGNNSGTEIWVDWYGLKYTPNVPRAVGFNV